MSKKKIGTVAQYAEALEAGGAAAEEALSDVFEGELLREDLTWDQFLKAMSAAEDAAEKTIEQYEQEHHCRVKWEHLLLYLMGGAFSGHAMQSRGAFQYLAFARWAVWRHTREADVGANVGGHMSFGSMPEAPEEESPAAVLTS